MVVGKKPDERALRKAGADLLDEMRARAPDVRLTKAGRDMFLKELAVTPEDKEFLLSLPVVDDER